MNKTLSKLAALAYAAYALAVDNKAYDGKPLKTYEELPSKIKSAWEAAAQEVTFESGGVFIVGEGDEAKAVGKKLGAGLKNDEAGRADILDTLKETALKEAFDKGHEAGFKACLEQAAQDAEGVTLYTDHDIFKAKEAAYAEGRAEVLEGIDLTARAEQLGVFRFDNENDNSLLHRILNVIQSKPGEAVEVNENQIHAGGLEPQTTTQEEAAKTDEKAVDKPAESKGKKK